MTIRQSETPRRRRKDKRAGAPLTEEAQFEEDPGMARAQRHEHHRQYLQSPRCRDESRHRRGNEQSAGVSHK